MPTGCGGGGCSYTRQSWPVCSKELWLCVEMFDALSSLAPGPYSGNPPVTNHDVYDSGDPASLRYVLFQMALVLSLLEQRSNSAGGGGNMSKPWPGPQGAADAAADRLMQFVEQLLTELQHKPYADGGSQFRPNISWDQTGTGDVRRTRHI